MFHGFINVNKPVGMTSHDVVAKIRRLLSMKKVGHTGTLDPQVTGVLPVAVGQATKLTEYVLEREKTYRGSMILGISTTTEDFTGETIELKTDIPEPSMSDIIEAMAQLTGVIEQIPPMFSAVKIKGKKLYELARSGIEVERQPRKVTIYSFIPKGITSLEIEGNKFPIIDFEVTCSKGTYVRTLCVDIGKTLHVPACMYSLIRTESAGFTIENSVTFDQIAEFVESQQIEKFLVDMDYPIRQYPTLYLSEQQSKKAYNGMALQVPFSKVEGQQDYDLQSLFRIYDFEKTFFAIYKLVNRTNDYLELKAEKVFKEVLDHG